MQRSSVSGIIGLALTFLGTGMRFVFPNLLVPPLWGWIMIASGLVLLSWPFLCWIAAFAKPPIDFEDVRTWSVSMRFPGHASGALPNGTVYFVLTVELVNLSSSQTRVIDLKISAPTPDLNEPVVYLETEHTIEQPYREHLLSLVKDGKLPAGNADKFIDLPITLPPNSAISGLVEFQVRAWHEKGVGPGKNTHVTDVRAFERRAHLTKIVGSGMCYDARIQKAYKGELGLSFGSLRYRWREYRRRKSGKPIIMHGY